MSQGCLKAVAYALMVLGILLGLLGIVFVLAPGKIATGLILLVIAVPLIGLAANRLAAMRRLTPEYLQEQIMSLAAASDGEMTLAAACGYLRLEPARVAPLLQDLAARGIAEVERREGTDYFRFPGLTRQKMVKKCPSCGNEYPLSHPGRTCPSCGGNLQITPD